jgi:hypothetical protein
MRITTIPTQPALPVPDGDAESLQVTFFFRGSQARARRFFFCPTRNGHLAGWQKRKTTKIAPIGGVQ